METPNPETKYVTGVDGKPAVCHVINGKNFWLDETLSEKQRDSVLAFIKAVTKFSGK